MPKLRAASVGTVSRIMPEYARVFVGEREVKIGDDIHDGDDLRIVVEGDRAVVYAVVTIDRKVP